MELNEAILGRRSIRAFLSDPVPRRENTKNRRTSKMGAVMGKYSALGNCRGGRRKDESISRGLCGRADDGRRSPLGRSHSNRLP